MRKSLQLLLIAVSSVLLVKADPAAKDPSLKPNDMIRLTVFEEPELDTATRILKSGDVVLPLIGTVKISGLTVSQANDTVRNLYAQDYLVDPKVSLTITEYSQDFVYVVGAVNGPGQFPIPPSGSFDLSSALASAGGLAPGADRNNIIVSKPDGKTSSHSAAGLQSGAVVPLSPGDRVVVQQSAYLNKSVTIIGEVQKAGAVPFPVDGRLDLLAAIAQAGGYTELAQPKKVSINRKGQVTVLNLKEMTDKGNQRYYLQPDDIVTVAQRFF